MKTSLAILFSLALLASVGCQSRSSTRETAQAAQPSNAAGSPRGVFDFYVFSLSWSPEFCETHPNSHECASRPGFVVHGLWPQNNDGTYPENCGNSAQPTNPSGYLNLIPSMSLIEHEWTTHGSCSGLNPDEYFSEVRRAFQSFEIPSTFAKTSTPPARVDPEVILNQFREDNPSFPRSSFALSCPNNSLSAIEVCFDKRLNPIACQGIHSCRARSITIPEP